MDIEPWTKIEQRPDGHDRERCGPCGTSTSGSIVSHISMPRCGCRRARLYVDRDPSTSGSGSRPLPVLLGLLDDPWTDESAARNPQITNEG